MTKQLQDKANLTLLSDVIVTVASWEERFILGLEELIKNTQAKSVLMFSYTEYDHWSKDNVESATELCKVNNVTLVPHKLNFATPLETWKAVIPAVEELIKKETTVTLDISTMPREVIWIICDLLNTKAVKAQYAYHRPKEYAEDWLSRDPGTPRFVYKLSGVSKLGLPTTLVILTGFDVERAKQLVRFYEPENLIIGLQVGDQYENSKRNRDKHISGFTRNKEIKWFDVDGFSLEKSIDALEICVGEIVNKSNVILTSLGPKISSLAIIKYHLKYQQTSIAYAPSNEFNKDYSHGFEDTICNNLGLS